MDKGVEFLNVTNFKRLFCQKQRFFLKGEGGGISVGLHLIQIFENSSQWIGLTD